MKSSGKSIQGQLTNILNNQREILSTVKLVRKEVNDLQKEFDKRKEESHEPISVPNRIRTAVKEYFASGEDIELKWDYQKRYYDEVNAEMTEFIKRKVKGVAPDVSNEVLDAAVKRYFTSKKEGANRKSKNKDTLHKQRQATYERKKEKVRRRLLSTEKKTNWPQEKREAVSKLLKSKMSHKLMSSDEEGDDGFITHPYSWESETWRNIKSSLDKTYLKNCPPRSARLLQKRTKGSIKEQDKPDVDEEFNWIFD
ncbi:putative autophagy-related protein 11 [Saccostrea cucullata]|uniref:putative autophagy-related protein 11 n=1 Tax=Saccostrea cuccullata TaxID=36930 RepID=UPI002ED0047A